MVRAHNSRFSEFLRAPAFQPCRVRKMLPGNNPPHPPSLTILVWPPQCCSSSIGGRWFDRHWIWCLELPRYLFSTVWPVVGLCVNVCPPWKDPLWWGMRAVPSYQGTVFTQQLDNKNMYVCVLHIYHIVYMCIYTYIILIIIQILHNICMYVYIHTLCIVYTHIHAYTWRELTLIVL